MVDHNSIVTIGSDGDPDVMCDGRHTDLPRSERSEMT